jgi:hypothetical protein
MKKLAFAFFMAVCCFGFAQQQNEVSRTHYYYTVLNVENEQLLQQVIDEISAYKSITDCKYRIKPEKKMAEITFTFNEQIRKNEGDKGTNPLPNVKQLLLDKGLQYSGFTFQTEKTTN